MKTVAVLVGSARAQSINMNFARALEKLGEGRLRFDFVDLASIPMFNDDDVADFPAAAQALKDQVAAADAVLLVTPEHNRSFSALLKSAIDWGTRPAGQNSWNGKPGAIVGTSPGGGGTLAAQMQLRAVMVGLGLQIMGRPEVLFQMKPDLIDDAHNVTNEGTREFLSGFIDAFVDHIDKLGS